MTTFASKTPVSSLQEYLVSKKLIPKYELVHNGVGTHKPEFIFRVQVGTLCEDGVGRSKQEAKHRAAEKMLRSLKVTDEKDAEEEKNDSFEQEVLDQELLDNYVGQLKDLCYSQHYPEPKYYLEEEGGPPHSKIFKMICCVSQLQESGIHRTKKQAKQQAAYRMIQRLKEVGGKKIKEALAHPETLSRYTNKSLSPLMTDLQVVDKYHSMKGTNVPTDSKDNAAFYKDHYKAYIDLKENSPTLKRVMADSKAVNSENSLNLLQEIAKELEATIDIGKIPSHEKNMDFTIMTLSIIPPVGDIGNSEESAAYNLLFTIIALCND